MTPAEIKDRIEAIAKSIGPKAYVSISVSTGYDAHGLVTASLWPEDLTGEHHVTARANTFAKALDKLEASSREARSQARAPLPFDRDCLGRFVREAWVRWAMTQPNPKPSWLVPYDELSEADQEADRQIGEAVATWVVIGLSAQWALAAREKEGR